MISKKLIGAPALAASTSSIRRGELVVGDQLAGDADALGEAHQVRRGEDVAPAGPAASPMARRKAQVEPLPLVPAT